MWWGDGDCAGACAQDGVLPFVPCVLVLIVVVVAALLVRWADAANRLRPLTERDPSTPADPCGTLSAEGEGAW
jgi:hypothetical protein